MWDTVPIRTCMAHVRSFLLYILGSGLPLGVGRVCIYIYIYIFVLFASDPLHALPLRVGGPDCCAATMLLRT